MRCDVCSVEWAGRSCPNFWCGRADRGFDAVWAIGTHTGRLRRAIAALKYRADLRWALPLGRLLAEFLVAGAPWFEDVDLIVGVPGGGSATDHIGAVLDVAGPLLSGWWDVDASVLHKRVATRKMMEAPSAEVRRLWAAGELRAALDVVAPDRVRGRHCLVVDDVFTDGSTLREVAGALRRAGAEAVSGVVLARQPLRPQRA